MADSLHKIEEKVVELEREAERGESERTPWIVLGGIQIAALVIIAVVMAIVFTAYLLA
ncbi:MAG TPA: hypothetical protein VIE18_06565 [Gaiellaceae bacterium]|jgi:hypothetical protein